TTALVSVATNGDQGDNFSELYYTGNSLSRDGRFVVFNGGANNFAAGDSGIRDIFVRDRDLDGNGIFDEAGPGKTSTQRVSQTMGGGNTNGGNQDQGISANGRYVVFGSEATNLGAPGPCTYGGNPAVCFSIMLKDMQTGDIELISVDSNGNPGNG